jgi:hypothetical protein
VNEISVEQRLAEIEEVLLMLTAALTGQPPDATVEENMARQERLGSLLVEMQNRYIARGL